MSRKKSDRRADALARETEDRMALFAFDQRIERQAELDRQANREFLLSAKQELARDRLEAEAVDVENYRATAVAQATAAKSIAPQFIPFIGGASREDIDAAVALAQAKTAEIVAEIAGQGEPGVQGRDAVTGRYVSQQEQHGEQIDRPSSPSRTTWRRSARR
jgi:hypothetical protein